MSASAVPPFSELVKSPEVEDPVNRWVHRPLAYAFVVAVYRTRLTPNAVTLIAMITGVAAGALWIWGARWAMVAGGVLLWASAILDGADGILARAKQQQSQYGRALDGSADMVVAIFTVLPAAYHLLRNDGLAAAPVALLAIVTTVAHLVTYDYYKESFLRMTRPERGGEGEDVPDVIRRVQELEEEGGRFITWLALKHLLLPYVSWGRGLVVLTNPSAVRDRFRFTVNDETAEIYRANNVGPMKLWAMISLCPHTYLLAVAGMFERFDVYLWFRLIGMNAVFLLAIAWQRRTTTRTDHDLAAVGAAPEPVPASL